MGIGFWLIAGIFAFAAPPTNGPPGGSVRSLIAAPLHPHRFYLGTATGLVFRSDDDGAHWQFLSRVAGYRDGVVARLAADPRPPGWLWAAVWNLDRPGGGIYVSTDGGHSWRLQLGGHSFHALAIAPSDPRTIVAGALDGVYASRDRGQHWRRISPPLNRALINIESLAISPRNPREIYAGTYHLLWKTFNGGHDWWQLRRGVITDSDIFAVAINPQSPQQVLMSSCSGIYESDNAGNQFRKIQGIPYSARRTRAIVPDPRQPGRIFAGTTQGLWETGDDGAHWQRTTDPDLIVNAIALDAARPGRILLGTDFAGVWASNDGGLHFHPVNRGLAARAPAAVAYDAVQHAFYVAINGNLRWGGVFASAGNGRHWSALRRGWPAAASVYRLRIAQGEVLAATNRGLWRYRAGRWQRLGGLREREIVDLAAAGGSLYAATAGGLWSSFDQGHRWQLRREAPIPAYRVAAAANGLIFVAGRNYVISSANRGRQFLSAPLRLRGRVNQILIRGNKVYVASSDGLYLSADRGAHWMLAGHGLPQMPVLSLRAGRHRITAITSDPNVVFVSDNAGRSWAPKPARPEAVLFAQIGGLHAFPWLSPHAARTLADRNPLWPVRVRAETNQHE